MGIRQRYYTLHVNGEFVAVGTISEMKYIAHNTDQPWELFAHIPASCGDDTKYLAGRESGRVVELNNKGWSNLKIAIKYGVSKSWIFSIIWKNKKLTKDK